MLYMSHTLEVFLLSILLSHISIYNPQDCQLSTLFSFPSQIFPKIDTLLSRECIKLGRNIIFCQGLPSVLIATVWMPELGNFLILWHIELIFTKSPARTVFYIW